jgi:hypothetical protein
MVYNINMLPSGVGEGEGEYRTMSIEGETEKT